MHVYTFTHSLTQFYSVTTRFHLCRSILTKTCTQILVMDSKYFPHGSPKTHTTMCPSMCSLLTCVWRQRAASHYLSLDVPRAHTHTHTDRRTDRQTDSLAILSTRGWVPPLFREEDVISLVKNPTYVACYSWLNPGFSFVQSAVPLVVFHFLCRLLSPSSTYLSICPSSVAFTMSRIGV